MTIDLAPLLYIVTGYVLAILTVYVTAACTRRIASGRSLPLRPRFRRSQPEITDEPTYRSRYENTSP